MWSTLLLISCAVTASSEWVEISQQHYRKPVRLAHHPTSDHARLPERPTIKEQFHRKEDPFKPNPDGDPYQIEVYPNASVSQTVFRNRYRVSGNVQRIQTDKHDEYSPFLDAPVLVTKYIEKEDDKVSATIERVSHVGTIKRVHLSDTPVKSPTITDIAKRNNFLAVGDTDELEMKPHVIFKDEKVSDINNSLAINPNDFLTTLKSYNLNNADRSPQNSDNTSKLDSANVEVKKIDVTNQLLTEAQNDTNRNVLGSSENVIKSDIDKILRFDKSDDYVKTNLSVQNKKTKPQEAGTPQDQSEGSKEDSGSQETTKAGEINMKAMENVMKFMKVVTETISKNTKRGVHGKVKYLNDLKDTLLDSIKSRIDATWPEEGGRRARAARGHVEFPSSESSLMTISFLTFAVFLIKLVLQVIQTYKNKTMVMAPLVVATAGRAVRKMTNSQH